MTLVFLIHPKLIPIIFWQGETSESFWKMYNSYLVKRVSPRINHWYVIFQARESERHQEKFVSRRKWWKRHEDSEKSHFRSHINKYWTSSQKDDSVEGTKMFWEDLCEKLHARILDGQKDLLDMQTYGSRMMMFVIVLVRSWNYERSGNREMHVRSF